MCVKIKIHLLILIACHAPVNSNEGIRDEFWKEQCDMMKEWDLEKVILLTDMNGLVGAK